MAAYTRRQILLKREDGTPAGFLRLERIDSRCEVEVQVDAKHKELAAFLLDGELILPLGKITRNRAIHAPRIDDIHRYGRAAILSGDRLLFVGGEGADFAGIRRTFQSQTLGAQQKKAAVIPKDDQEWNKLEAGGDSQGDSKGRREGRQAENDELESERINPAKADRASTRLTGADLADTPQADASWTGASQTQANHSLSAHLADSPIRQNDGWLFTPCPIGSFQCYAGRLMQNGRAVAKMHAMACAYDPEPPPGLTGFVWDSGYWVKVAAAEL